MKKFFVGVSIAASFLFMGGNAQAALIVDFFFPNDHQTIQSTDTLPFEITFQNSALSNENFDAHELYMNIGGAFDIFPYTIDLDPALSNFAANAFIAPGQSESFVFGTFRPKNIFFPPSEGLYSRILSVDIFRRSDFSSVVRADKTFSWTVSNQPVGAAVPEPNSFLILGTALLTFAVRRRSAS